MSERTSLPLYLAAVAIVYYAGLYVGVWISPHLGTCGRVGMTAVLTVAVLATAGMFAAADKADTAGNGSDTVVAKEGP